MAASLFLKKLKSIVKAEKKRRREDEEEGRRAGGRVGERARGRVGGDWLGGWVLSAIRRVTRM